MGGAFVGVVDDASAVYWNPGALARGAYFSLLLDGGTGEAAPDAGLDAGNRSGWILALTTPALGLSYYRLRTASVRPLDPDEDTGAYVLDSLVTHHAGVTLVHSLFDGIAVGASAKVIRAEAGSVSTLAERAEDLLDGWDVIGRTSSRLDLDVGIMARSDIGSVGLTLRNLTEPSFRTENDTELQLDRQIRGGASVLLLPAWKLAVDVDFTRTQGPLTEVREVAIGTEARIARRISARSGVSLNTAGDLGSTPGWSVGGSFAVFGSMLLDAQVTAGSDEALRGWGLAGRIVF
jgi:hypothetical protein